MVYQRTNDRVVPFDFFRYQALAGKPTLTPAEHREFEDLSARIDIREMEAIGGRHPNRRKYEDD